MVLDQGYWPESELTPPSDEAIQYDIRMTKEMGFNGARKHQKVEDPRYLYWADKMGLLVSGEMANAYQFDNVYAARFTREWIEAVERDVNHPSVIIWAPINESWGVPDLADAKQQAHLKANYWLTHSLDDTRLVIDNEGWEHTDQTDLFAFHDYARTGDQLLREVQGPDDEARIARARHQRAGARARLSRTTGRRSTCRSSAASRSSRRATRCRSRRGATPAWRRRRRRRSSGCAGSTSAIAQIPAIGGICYTQLTDVEQEINGLMTYDRKPKFDTKAVKEINGLLR